MIASNQKGTEEIQKRGNESKEKQKQDGKNQKREVKSKTVCKGMPQQSQTSIIPIIKVKANRKTLSLV